MAGTITYFGYGSLVNRATRPADEKAYAARLHGWHRCWSHRIHRFGELKGCSSLNIRELATNEPVFDGGIDGVVACMPTASLDALDAREAGYDRWMLPASHFDLPPNIDTDEVAVYVSKRVNTHPATEAYPVLQSYIDCVMAGFLDRFGAEGLAHFVASTDGWNLPVENDRARPRYARALELPAHVLAQFDDLLSPRRLSA